MIAATTAPWMPNNVTYLDPGLTQRANDQAMSLNYDTNNVMYRSSHGAVDNTSTHWLPPTPQPLFTVNSHMHTSPQNHLSNASLKTPNSFNANLKGTGMTRDQTHNYASHKTMITDMPGATNKCTGATCSETDNSTSRTSSNLEKFALAALTRIFPGKEFHKVRPSWLRNPQTGRTCELDFYSDELKLAVEVQGMQHYVYPNSWHKNRTEWEEQVFRDRLKEDACKKAGVTLVHIPFTVQRNKLDSFIREEIQRVALKPMHTNLNQI